MIAIAAMAVSINYYCYNYIPLQCVATA